MSGQLTKYCGKKHVPLGGQQVAILAGARDES